MYLKKQHGGSITFESELGKSTTFYIRLPVTEKSVAKVAQAARCPQS